jgi:hypothetical protein
VVLNVYRTEEAPQRHSHMWLAGILQTPALPPKLVPAGSPPKACGDKLRRGTCGGGNVRQRLKSEYLVRRERNALARLAKNDSQRLKSSDWWVRKYVIF